MVGREHVSMNPIIGEIGYCIGVSLRFPLPPTSRFFGFLPHYHWLKTRLPD